MREPLRGRRWDIATGRADLPLETIARYRQHWADQGYELPAIGQELPRVKMRGIGDLAARVFKWLRIPANKTCGCYARQQWLNDVVPFPVQWTVVPLP